MKKQKQKQNGLNRLIDVISGIFIPVIPVLMGAALLKGVLLFITNLGWLQDTDGAYQILYAASDGFFYFLPIFLAYTSAMKLKADPFTAIAIATALLYPSITKIFELGETIDFFGVTINPVTYHSSVIPIILSIILLHFVELWLKKILPTAIKGFMKPLISLAIVVPVTFLIFGPFGALIGDGLAKVYGILYGYNPIIAGVLFGLIWQPMVVFGFHWGMVPIIISNINQYGMDSILPLLGPAVFGQAGAAMAVSFMTKHKDRKTVAFSGSITAILGVTEPVLYGITMPLKKPMIAACIAGAIGGGMVGSSGSRALSFAFPSLITLVVYLGEGFVTYIIACVVGFIVGFGLTYVFKFDDTIGANMIGSDSIISEDAVEDNRTRR